MGAYQDQGIVLKTKGYRENDGLVTLFLVHQGKVAAVGRGMRKPRSPLLAGLYPLSYSGFELYRGRSSLESVVGAEVIHGFGRIRNDLDRIGWGTLMAEVVDECFSDHDPDPEAFYILVAGLQALNDGRHPPSVVMVAIWQLLRTAGFVGPISHCSICSQELSGSMAMMRGERQPACARCAQTTGRASRIFSAGIVKTVNRWLELPPDRFGGVEVRGRSIAEMVALLTMVMTTHLRRSPRSLGFVTQLLETEREEPR